MFDDNVNLKSQYAECSYGQLQFEKATLTGVLTVNLNETVVGQTDFTVRGWVGTAVAAAMGVTSLSQVAADHIMFCLPHGVERGGGTNWLAYAYINHYLSVYNDG